MGRVTRWGTEFEQKGLVLAVRSARAEQAEQGTELRVNTPGGRFQVRRDENGSATALRQLAFFAEFPEVSGLFERWVANCPMACTSPNPSAVRDVLGTWLRSILEGQRRSAQGTGLRGDCVAPRILGMTKIVSDASLRRDLAHLAPTLKRRPEDRRPLREQSPASAMVWTRFWRLRRSCRNPNVGPPSCVTSSPESSATNRTIPHRSFWHHRIRSSPPRGNRGKQDDPCCKGNKNVHGCIAVSDLSGNAKNEIRLSLGTANAAPGPCCHAGAEERQSPCFLARRQLGTSPNVAPCARSARHEASGCCSRFRAAP